jgi:hypothetical protein
MGHEGAENGEAEWNAMKSPGLLTMLMLVSAVVLAVTASQPRAGQRDNAGLFGLQAAKTSCATGTRYSSFYNACIHSYAQASYR